MRINICESCEFGYPADATSCPYCGAGGWLSQQVELVEVPCDTECYRDYWLCKIGDDCFEMFPGHPLDITAMRRALSRVRVFTFNGNNYDIPMISAAAMGWDNSQLKQLSDAIIQQNLKPWDLERHYGVRMLQLNHVDLFEVLPGEGSLKAYGGKMHAPKLQDLPIDPSASIDWPQRVLLREYCGNDTDTTWLAREAMRAQIRLREEISAEYSVDVCSKSDAQIAEAVVKATVPFRIEKPAVAVGATFYYRPPKWLEFAHLPLLQLMARSPFKIAHHGGVEMAPELAETVISIGDGKYKMGSGGLHSMEQRQLVVADDAHEIVDRDVASYYPSLILETGIYPPQIGEMFQTIYRGWYDKRIAAKHAGDKKTANTLKTYLNGIFGKLGSQYSIFYAPSEMIQVTVTGQLALLMLIERFEMSGIRVISANTDGVVTYCHKGAAWLRDEIIHWWEQCTGFVTEETRYRLVASRDVNSYVAITTDNGVKLKGAFAPPEPGPSGWPNPTTQVCVDAVVAYLRDGTPLAATILACRDVRQFISVRKVTGGGYYAERHLPRKYGTRAEMRALLGDMTTPDKQLRDAYEAAIGRLPPPQLLGKVVRWYYATGSNGCIVTKAGNKVAKTEGCRPMMELTDGLPEDLDYNWYIREAASMLVDIGVMGG